MIEELTDDLHDLIDKVEIEVAEDLEELPEENVTYLVDECISFDYDGLINSFSDAKNSNTVEISRNEETRTEYTEAGVYDEIVTSIHESDEYKSIVKSVCDRKIIEEFTDDEEKEIYEADIPEQLEEPIFLINNFVNIAIDETIEAYGDDENLSDTVKTELISALFNELRNSPTDWKLTIWLLGIGAEFEETKLSDDTVIAQPVKEDLTTEIRLDTRVSPELTILPRDPPTLKISREVTVEDKFELRKEEYVILSLMRLYASGSCKIVGKLSEPDSPLLASNKDWTDETMDGFSFAKLEEGDDEHIENCFSEIEGPFRENIINSTDTNYLSIAYDRYEEGLVNATSTEAVIASSIMCLEALYLKEQENSELSHRLSERVSILLGFLDAPEMEIYQKVKNGYDIRSSYVHGSSVDDEDYTELSLQLLNIARKSLVLHLQISTEMDKDKIIGDLDKCTVIPESRDSTKEDVENICGYKPLRNH
ncbi:HEPN domain-containing protein [Halobacterium sp. KA-6]|uniref:HEPN domain-containing protein n=1 Tax=Halobacterium sp. KA-6 TaxID=2896368 RepID=UPI001E47E04C|nr:HEPN domain-containing protein [Halobacterium sp. KA-6]MCD2201869.1 hypothetical protein [Halobacterium sp. KA-6]